jgi:hypothetical protein
MLGHLTGPDVVETGALAHPNAVESGPLLWEVMKAELRRILDAKPSPNLFEICTKSLKE